METPNQNQTPSQPPTQPIAATKWYQHKGFISILVLAILAAAASWIYFSRQPKADLSPIVVQHEEKLQQNASVPTVSTSIPITTPTATNNSTPPITQNTVWQPYVNTKYNYEFSYPEDAMISGSGTDSQGAEVSEDIFCYTDADSIKVLDSSNNPLFEINGSQFKLDSQSDLAKSIFTTFKTIDPIVQPDQTTWNDFTSASLGISFKYPKSYSIDPQSTTTSVILNSPITPIISSECTSGETSDAISIYVNKASELTGYFSDKPFSFSDNYFLSKDFSNAFNTDVSKTLVGGKVAYQFTHSEATTERFTITPLDGDNYLLVVQELFNWDQQTSDATKMEPYNGIVASIKFTN